MSNLAPKGANTHRPSRIEDLHVSVIGAGLMGHSIAGVFAVAGARVSAYDPHEPTLSSVPRRVAEQLTRRGLNASAADTISLHANLEQATSMAHLVIEAVPERLELKQDLFAQLGELLPHAVLATNSSVLRTSDVAARTSNPGRVLGTHWFNPPHLVPIVEVIQSAQTAFVYIDWIMDLLTQAGKLPVHVKKDVPGFIGNRLQHALWREAIHLVESGVCDADTVDLVARNSFGMRLAAMGPIENADYVGLDLVQAVHENVFPSLCSEAEPAGILRDLVRGNHLGAKTGAGFLEWPPGRREEAARRLDAHLIAQLGEARG